MTLAFEVPLSSCIAVCKTYLAGDTTAVSLFTTTKVHAIAAQCCKDSQLATLEIFQGSWKFICRFCRGSVLLGLTN